MSKEIQKDGREGYTIVRPAKISQEQIPYPRPVYTVLTTNSNTAKLEFAGPRFSGTGRTHLPHRPMPKWNKNWLDGSIDWFLAISDYRVYNIFVDAINERLIAIQWMSDPFADPAAVMIPHAKADDFSIGFAVAITGPSWAYLCGVMTNMPSAATVRADEPIGSGSPFFEPGAQFFVDPQYAQAPADTNYTSLTRHLPVYSISRRAPLEIADFNGPYTNGAHARLIGFSNLHNPAVPPANGLFFGKRTGHIFKCTGASWVKDDSGTGGLPDVIEQVPVLFDPPESSSIGLFADDTQVSGNYFGAKELQTLRDKINMTTRFLLSQQPHYPGTNDCEVSGYDGPIPSTMLFTMDTKKVAFYSGGGTGTTLAAANGSAQATWSDRTCPIGFDPSAPNAPLDGLAYWPFSIWEGGGSGTFYSVAAQRQSVTANAWNLPNGALAPGTIRLACQLYFGLLAYSPHKDPPPSFQDFGDPFIDSEGNPTIGIFAETWTTFHHVSPVLGTTTTNYASTILNPSASVFPDGSGLFGTNTSAAFGYTALPLVGGEVNAVGEFGVVDFGVPGGFRYTKDTTF